MTGDQHAKRIYANARPLRTWKFITDTEINFNKWKIIFSLSCIFRQFVFCVLFFGRNSFIAPFIAVCLFYMTAVVVARAPDPKCYCDRRVVSVFFFILQSKWLMRISHICFYTTIFFVFCFLFVLLWHNILFNIYSGFSQKYRDRTKTIYFKLWKTGIVYSN